MFYHHWSIILQNPESWCPSSAKLSYISTYRYNVKEYINLQNIINDQEKMLSILRMCRVTSVKEKPWQLENLKCFSLIWKCHWVVCSSWLLILLAIYFLPHPKSDHVRDIVWKRNFIISLKKILVNVSAHTSLQGFPGAYCAMVQIQYFLFASWAGKSRKVMIVIITTRLLPNILPATSLLTLGGLNTWEKSIKRKSKSCPDLGNKSISPAWARKMVFTS